jgi:ACS family hexuronate transporter-like MFS transporter
MMKRGATINTARKTAMFLCACLVVPVMFGTVGNNPWICTLLLGLATAGHQGFSANQYAMVGDLFPKRAVASVSGLGGTFGYVGGAIYSSICGTVLTLNHNNYTPLLVTAGVAYLVAFGIIQVCTPRMEPAAVDAAQ